MTLEVRTLRGRRISAIRTGAGPLVVLIPPGASPASAWRRVTEILSPDFECLAINPSGYAKTESFVADRPMTLADEAEAAMALIGEQTGDVHLVGHSYGGAVAINMAFAHANRFKTLTLIEPAAYPMLRQAGALYLAEAVERVNHTFIQRVRAGRNEEAFRDYFDYYNGGPGNWDALSDAARQSLLSRSRAVAAALAAVHAADGNLENLEGLTMPVLVVAGAETDRVHARLSVVIAERTTEAFPDLIPGAGHMCSLTHPAELASLLCNHLRDS